VLIYESFHYLAPVIMRRKYYSMHVNVVNILIQQNNSATTHDKNQKTPKKKRKRHQ